MRSQFRHSSKRVRLNATASSDGVVHHTPYQGIISCLDHHTIHRTSTGAGAAATATRREQAPLHNRANGRAGPGPGPKDADTAAAAAATSVVGYGSAVLWYGCDAWHVHVPHAYLSKSISHGIRPADRNRSDPPAIKQPYSHKRTHTATMPPLSLTLLLLLLLLACGTSVVGAEGPTKTCIVRVGEYVMDLTPLASTQFPLECASPDGRHVYRAVLCGATSVLADSCKVGLYVCGWDGETEGDATNQYPCICTPTIQLNITGNRCGRRVQELL